MATPETVNVPPLPPALSSALTGGTSAVSGAGTSGLSISLPSISGGALPGLPGLPTIQPGTDALTALAAQANGITVQQQQANYAASFAGTTEGKLGSYIRTYALPIILSLVGVFLLIFSMWAIFDRSQTVKTVSKMIGK